MGKGMGRSVKQPEKGKAWEGLWRRCVQCGEMFHAKHSRTLTCSPECAERRRYRIEQYGKKKLGDNKSIYTHNVREIWGKKSKSNKELIKELLKAMWRFETLEEILAERGWDISQLETEGQPIVGVKEDGTPITVLPDEMV